jgi:hypothetical protein
MGRNPHKRGTLLNRATHADYVGMLQVPKAAVDHAQTIRGRGVPKITLVYQRYRKPAQRGVPSDADAVDASADDHHIVGLSGKVC